MSYCRFQNTYLDLLDCINALNDNGVNDLSDRELQYAERMLELCEEMLGYVDVVADEIENRKEQVQ
jgi:hypothetical protein